MNTIIKIAWRNIWRNKRRTFITIASIMFALFFAIIMRGFALGAYSNMKENAVESYSGYVQINKKGYWDDKNINNIFTIDKGILDKVKSTENVKTVIPRLESFALASTGETTKGVAVMGISPERENEMTKMKTFMKEGEFISENDKSVLVAEDLAKYLKVEVNDTLVLYSSGYHGTTAAGLYPIKGIVSLPTPEMNMGTISIPIKEAQNLYSAPNMFTAIALNLNSVNDVDDVISDIKVFVNTDEYDVLSWEKMNEELLQMIEADNAGQLIMIGILYMVIAFGILGTVLMMTNERLREFSVMISIGMQKYKLAMVVVLELIMLTIIAIFAGISISLPVGIYFYNNPIQFSGKEVEAMKSFNLEPSMPMSIDVEVFAYQALTISIITLVAMTYPVIKIFTMNVVSGLRG